MNASEDARPKRAKVIVAKRQRYVVPDGRGKYSVLEGVKLNDEPINQDALEAYLFNRRDN